MSRRSSSLAHHRAVKGEILDFLQSVGQGIRVAADFTAGLVSYDDVFKPEFTERIPEWFDSKKYKSTDINSMIYENFGGSEESGLPINAIVTDAFFHPEGTDMEKACQWLVCACLFP